MTEFSDEGARKDLKDITQKKVLKIKGKVRSVSYGLTGDQLAIKDISQYAIVAQYIR